MGGAVIAPAEWLTIAIVGGAVMGGCTGLIYLKLLEPKAIEE